MSKRALDWFMVLGTLTLVTIFGVVAVCTTAYAQSASQPVVVAPVAASGGWAWFLANSGWIVPLAISLLSSIATGLSDYPKAGGVVRGLRIAVAVLGVVQFRDGKGSIKAPLAPPAKP